MFRCKIIIPIKENLFITIDVSILNMAMGIFLIINLKKLFESIF